MKNFIVAGAVVAALALTACGGKTEEVPHETPQEMPSLPAVDSSAIKDSLAKAAATAKAAADSAAKAAEELAKKAAATGKKAVKNAKEEIKTVIEKPTEKKEGEAVGGTIRKSR